MSWSFTAVGTVEGVVKELDAYGETLTGQSKTEFEDAKPAIVSLLNLNTSNVSINANGHAYESAGSRTSQCAVDIKGFYGKWCA